MKLKTVINSIGTNPLFFLNKFTRSVCHFLAIVLNSCNLLFLISSILKCYNLDNLGCWHNYLVTYIYSMYPSCGLTIRYLQFEHHKFNAFFSCLCIDLSHHTEIWWSLYFLGRNVALLFLQNPFSIL